MGQQRSNNKCKGERGRSRTVRRRRTDEDEEGGQISKERELLKTVDY